MICHFYKDNKYKQNMQNYSIYTFIPFTLFVYTSLTALKTLLEIRNILFTDSKLIH